VAAAAAAAGLSAATTPQVRPGRIGARIFVGPPEDQAEVAAVVEACLAGTPLLLPEGLTRQGAVRTLARMTKPGESRAHIADFVRRGVMRALAEDPEGVAGVALAHFSAAE
jgi:SpoVK/Ycf46/Vps4 family AAA+-type ATPase